MSIIKKYLKENENINLDYIDSYCLSKSKLYKILDLLYILDNTNLPITSEIIEKVIKELYIFNDIVLVLKSWIIKVSFKYDIAVV